VAKILGDLFGGGTKQRVTNIAAQERREAADTAEAALKAEEEARTTQKKGRASNILTRDRGLLEDEETESRRLLGGK
jgi:hypothetical protein